MIEIKNQQNKFKLPKGLSRGNMVEKWIRLDMQLQNTSLTYVEDCPWGNITKKWIKLDQQLQKTS